MKKILKQASFRRQQLFLPTLLKQSTLVFWHDVSRDHWYVWRTNCYCRSLWQSIVPVFWNSCEGVENEKETGVYLTRERKMKWNGDSETIRIFKHFFKGAWWTFMLRMHIEKGCQKIFAEQFYEKKLKGRLNFHYKILHFNVWNGPNFWYAQIQRVVV